MNSIDLGRAIRAPFADNDWVVKTALGLLFGVLVITGPIIWGAQLVYIRSVARGDERLPAWDDWVNMWVRGFLIAVAGFIYFLPVIVMAILFLAPAAVTTVFQGEAGAAAGGAAIGGACLLVLLASVYMVLVSVIFYAATVNYAIRDHFGAFFEFGTIMRLVQSGSGYFTAWLFALVLGVGASAVTSTISAMTGGLLFLVTPAVTYLATMMTGHVLGQWAARAYGITGAGRVDSMTHDQPGGGHPGSKTYPPAGDYSPPPPPA